MAQRLGVGPEAICKIEVEDDIQAVNLRRYVEALGAELRIGESGSVGCNLLLQLKNIVAEKSYEDNQLILPMFEGKSFHTKRDIIISIKPKYTDKIIQGRKTVELRRRFPSSTMRGTIAHIYSTSPVQAMVGRAEISDIVRLPVSAIWREYGSEALVEKKDFDEYFCGLEEGVVLKLENVLELPRHFSLSELRERFGFEPPQSFLYAKPDLQGALQDEYTSIPN